ncbi:MAG: Hsp20/alpha crystallin family protein [Candidatus Dormibacteria bacterium]
MALIRWNPWNELSSLHGQMDQLFNEAFANENRQGGGVHVNLPVDIRQTDEAYFIEASVPGFKPEDVDLTFDDGVLTIRGTHNAEQEHEQDGYVRRERRMSSFYRQVGLPAEVRADEISAAYENGVLTVTVPRAQKAQPKRIPVTSGGKKSPARVVDAVKGGSKS